MDVPPLTGTIAGKFISWSYNWAKCKLLAQKIKFDGSLIFQNNSLSGKLNLIIEPGIDEKLIFYGVQFFQRRSLGRANLIREQLEEYNFGHGQYVNQGANFSIQVNLTLNDQSILNEIGAKKLYYKIVVKFSNGCIISSPKLQI